MIGLIFSILLVAVLFIKFHNRLTPNQILHIWIFSFAFHQCFDVFVLIKHLGYWYFTKEIEWKGLIPYLFLVPPVNIVFLNQYPFNQGRMKRIGYISIWTISIFLYEDLTLLPEPWGYFHYGWWKLWYSLLLDPILLIILLLYYQLIRRLEKAGKESGKEI